MCNSASISLRRVRARNARSNRRNVFRWRFSFSRNSILDVSRANSKARWSPEEGILVVSSIFFYDVNRREYTFEFDFNSDEDAIFL